MRLTCPNCGAQYEVPDEVIPESGRDVQCSNCGDTWFQYHPDHQPAEEIEAAEAPHPGYDSPEDDADVDAAPEPGPEPETVAEAAPDPEEEDTPDEPPEVAEEPEPEVDEAEASDPDAEDFSEDDDLEADAEPAEPQPVQRSGLDPSIADVLREEAAREEEARARESGGGLETQPDLGLDGRSDEEEQRAEQARSRMARMRGLPEDAVPEAEEPETDPGLISRRNLLPDIDEINSSLDSESARAEKDLAADGGLAGAEAVAQKGGFSRGFIRGVLLVLVLVLFYVAGPMIAEKVPALAGAVSAYVDTVNAGRLWLNDLVASR